MHCELVAAWDGVDYLFLDEVSMIGCNLLLSSQSLADAKDKKIPFGGVNVIFVGDFAQLPPVGETKLYAHINTTKVNTSSGQNAVFGKILWLSVNTVVTSPFLVYQIRTCLFPWACSFKNFQQFSESIDTKQTHCCQHYVT